ncbi:MAG: alpha-L-fucosidase [Bacteroidetes bacterium]|nr:alpha-L-fucosidase [Bacteroidota bacterium]
MKKELFIVLLPFLVGFRIVAMAQLSYNLPPIPEKESRHLGFITDTKQFEEEKMDFPIASGKFGPSWESINDNYQRTPDWWREAKFGIFIHWGPQASGMSGDWYARELYKEGTLAYKNHLINFGHPSEVGYKDVLDKWNPKDWNPEKLVQAYYDAGFRYALIVGVHHDNFDMWNSKYQPWNAVNVGPKKDFLGLWKKALQAKGMHFGVSFHHEYTWWWWQRSFGSDATGSKAGIPYDARLTLADGKGKWWDGLDPQRLYGIPMDYTNLIYDDKPYDLENIPFGRKGIFGNNLDYAKWYATQWAMRIIDVIDNYDPDFIYTDGNSTQPFSGDHSGSGYKCDAAARVVAHFYNKSSAKNNGMVDKLAIIKFSPPYKGVGTTFEGFFPKGIKTDQTWMADRAVGDWFYRPGFVYDAGAVVHTLLEDVSRDGNLTLCVSLTPSGAMDDGSARMLKEIGAWMKINGEGIYGSKAWKVFEEGELVKDQNNAAAPEKIKGMPGGKLDKIHAEFPFSTKDFRFTEGKDGSVYAFCMTVPKPGETIWIKSLGSRSGIIDQKVRQVILLGSNSKLNWYQEDFCLKIICPNKMDFHYVVCFKVE